MDKSFLIDNEKITINKLDKSEDIVEFYLDGKKYKYKLKSIFKNKVTIEENGISKHALTSNDQVLYKNDCFFVIKESSLKRSQSNDANSGGAMVSPMPGKIFQILVNVGDVVKQGDPLLILEAMKMEHSVRAAQDGIVKEIYFKEGELVDGGVVLASLETKEC